MIGLACAVEPGTLGIAQAVAEQGAPAVLSEVLAKEPTQAVRGRVLPEQVPGLLASMARIGVRVVAQGDREYPTQLLDLPEPPLALWVRGPLDLRASSLRSVAVVGARACTSYGEQAASLVAGELAERDWSVVSGGAFGIDAAAHRAALAVGGPTIAVMACGVDVHYPRSHDALLCRIADSGAVISELPPGSQPLRHRFLNRNRLIAALSRATVVVEAARRSGALATANRAMELSRPVLAVPGPITSMASAGTNLLIQTQGAHLVCEAADVVRAVTAGDEEQGDPGGISVPTHIAPLVDLLPLRGGGVGTGWLAERAGMAEATVLAHLGILELTGVAERTRRGWRRA